MIWRSVEPFGFESRLRLNPHWAKLKKIFYGYNKYVNFRSSQRGAAQKMEQPHIGPETEKHDSTTEQENQESTSKHETEKQGSTSEPETEKLQPGKDDPQPKFRHHWIAGNLPLSCECEVCEELCGDSPGIVDLRCCWCQRFVPSLSSAT